MLVSEGCFFLCVVLYNFSISNLNSEIQMFEQLKSTRLEQITLANLFIDSKQQNVRKKQQQISRNIVDRNLNREKHVGGSLDRVKMSEAASESKCQTASFVRTCKHLKFLIFTGPFHRRLPLGPAERTHGRKTSSLSF